MTISWNFNRFYSLEEWEKIVEDWEKSGLTKRAYCKKQQLVYRTFCEWEKKIHPSTPLTRQEIEERWRKIVKNWEKSGLSPHAYCSAKGLNKSVFWQWERRFNPHILRKTPHMKAVERWTPIVEDWEKSGLKQSLYCRKHGLSASALCKWVKRLDSLKDSGKYADFIGKPQVENLPENLVSAFLEEDNTIDPLPMGQKIEVTLSQGQHFCLEGPLNWQKLTAWLTPLLTR